MQPRHEQLHLVSTPNPLPEPEQRGSTTVTGDLASPSKPPSTTQPYSLRTYESRCIVSDKVRSRAMPSIPQTYTISDIIEWHSKGQLVLDPEFQRGSVWTPTAKVFLIDTILNDLPLPQIFLRTKVNPTSQITIREVVDGQQRLRTILEFASGKLRLSYKAQSFKGKYYKDLELSDQESFLAYRIPVVQLLNATDADVLEVFARLNSYSVKVTPAELRHAEYSEPVKWAIYHATRDWSSLWSDYGIVSVRDSVRLKNTSVIAELFMILDEGFNDGGETRINSYYKTHKTCDEEYFLPFSSCP